MVMSQQHQLLILVNCEKFMRDLKFVEQKQIQRILTIDCLVINIHMSRTKGVLTPVRDSNLTNISSARIIIFPEKENCEMFALFPRSAGNAACG